MNSISKSILIKEVENKSDLKKFIKFQFSLYKDNPYFVPPLIHDELATFNKKT
nr:GTP cyclohydrolase [Candidatus Kapabacteria bacterium]